MNRKMLSWLKQNNIIFISYGVAFLIILILYAIMRIYPFGSNHILQVDAISEYAPRLNELYNKIRNGESLFYSWKGGLGNDFYLSFVTSMLNPFIYIGLFFETKSITEVFMLINLLQIPMCALTCSFYLKNKYEKKNIIVLFSLMYAFSSYVTAYFWVYYWLIGVIVLPLISLGLERLVKEKKIILYTISLSIGILSNYMMGLFLCCFSVSYYLILVFKQKGTAKRIFKFSFAAYVKTSLLAGGIAAIAIIPALMSLQNTTYIGSGRADLSFKIYFSFLNFLTAHYFNMTPTVVQAGYGLPNVYVGLFTFILLIFYFINGTIKIREKILYGASLIILYLFSNINVLDYIIHGLHYTNGLPHRFMFIYCFLIINLAIKSLNSIRHLSKNKFYITYISIAFVSVILFQLYPIIRIYKPGVFSKESVIGNVCLLAVYFFILKVYRKNGDVKDKIQFAVNSEESKTNVFKRKKYIINVFLIVIVIAELSINALSNFKLYQEHPDRNLYVLQLYDDIQEIKGAAETLSNDTGVSQLTGEKSNEFYRMEHIPNRTMSDGKLFGYNGISIFSMTYDPIILMMEKFGVTASTNKIEYRMGTPLMNSIFSIKYTAHRGVFSGRYPLYFNKVETAGKETLAVNNHYLPVAFMVNREMAVWDAEKMEDTFEFQNAFVNYSTGISESLFSDSLEVDEVYGDFSTCEQIAPYTFSYTVSDDLNLNDTPVAICTFTTEEDGQYYISFNGGGLKSVYVFIEYGPENEIAITEPQTAIDTLDIGYIPKDTYVAVTFYIRNELLKKDKVDWDVGNTNGAINQLNQILFSNDNPLITDKAQSGKISLRLSRMDEDVYAKAYEAYADETLQVNYYDDTRIVGDISVMEDGVLFTSIPYDDRWHVYANGEEKETIKLVDALLGIELEQGSYEIEIIYKPKGIVMSVLITAVSVILLCFLSCKSVKEKTNVINNNAKGKMNKQSNV